MAKTTLRNFRCDDERWQAFVAACDAEGTDASKQIRELIDEWMAGRVMRRPPSRSAT